MARHKEAADTSNSNHNFAFNYGTEVVQNETESGHLADRELTALEEESLLDHLDDLSGRDRDYLDSLGAEFYIQDYYRHLRTAKQEQDGRVMQLKVTAVNLERTLAGKKPLKAAEIEGLLTNAGNEKSDKKTLIRRRGHRGRSSSPARRGPRRSSPSYEPYRESSSRSGSESPKTDNVEFIMEFQGEGTGGDDESWMELEPSPLKGASGSQPVTKSWSLIANSKTTTQHISGTSHVQGIRGSENDSYPSGIAATKMSLAEKLKQRMRQGLDQSIARAVLTGRVAAEVTAKLAAEALTSVAAEDTASEDDTAHQVALIEEA
ncbi:hypothetical protein BGZ65_006014 [Modicella reniformis]|uniref:Uncharacterized protein n=1 Tax=Modicella reniformis TaxID=1440133 RepID=A0A9P6IJK2_9FUNG|nr:hypothetical protein BGZ65_006014 [Modicella reniformis]